MSKRSLYFALSVLFSPIYVGTVPLYAVELMAPATQLGEKKVHVEIYYRHLANQDLNIEVGSAG